ncbi:hybrid sensor histidine kinase/response regulator [Jiella sonneratiae]|uniref:histidine kinase n=1 Tax=Jiella sonneratiae TaxID=2816856 RepID=A0ABS3J532_9HYPH|nr:ATP-binding protein [Jiella sonneratiae]MBO0904790.1 response regulator [Jiella sonneratiae]
MTAPQRILRVRRNYNQWVADETLEDFALRFTAKRARRFTPFQIAMTSCGGISFLALEAIGGSVILGYGFTNMIAALVVTGAMIFAAALPISYNAAKYGVDIDLLTRGAGFGYLGSTVTSLIYACFTFIFMAIEAAIMAMALNMVLGLPLWIGYIVSAVAVIPIVTLGIRLISRFQAWTQPLWLVLNFLPFAYLAWRGDLPIAEWTSHAGRRGGDGGFDLVLFGGASAILFALTAQIGEQVDYLRFLPRRTPGRHLAWWSALIAGGPGWTFIGAVKILAGSILAILLIGEGVAPASAQQPTLMYEALYDRLFANPALAVALTGIFVVVAQMKINVTNAYAGSIAWSNFFSRLTHSHPGRVVWLVFNVAISILLMEMGILKALEEILGLYAILAVSWVAPLVADLVVNKPLRLSPRHIEFKRAHLYDINPVGFGAMGAGIFVGVTLHTGLFGEEPAALAVYAALTTAFLAAPLIALLTGGRFYIARRPRQDWAGLDTIACCICEHDFEPEDMAFCPAYSGPICSLCCSLDARCHDLCKTGSRVREQIVDGLRQRISQRLAGFVDSPQGHYLAVFSILIGLSAAALSLIHFQTTLSRQADPGTSALVLVQVFIVLVILIGIASWLLVLAHESRRVAQEESSRQTLLLTQEIEAHRSTDAELQLAKERAEAASLAKTRFVVGMSHELRTPLNSILGFAQILEDDPATIGKHREGLSVIRRSGEHLAGLIDGLLDISRIEAGKIEIYNDVFNFGQLLNQIVEMFRLQAGNAGLDFVYEADGLLPTHVRGDEKRVRQILINLLSNAIKFTETGTIRFRVRYRNQIAALSVMDTGPGISKPDLERIFEPFERIEGKRATPGMGLGLTITKLFAEILGGDIQVESELGQGSAFHVRLMLGSVAEDVAAKEKKQRIVGYEGPPRTILSADDEPVHRQLVEEILSPLGFKVLTAESGETCLRMAKLCKPDLYLLDINMPGIDGWEVAKAAREQSPGVPIVMLSASARPPARDRHLYDDWIAKPLSIPALLDVIARALAVKWRFAGEQAALPEDDDRDFAAACQAHLTTDERAELITLIDIGYVRGIHARLDVIASRNADAGRVVSRLRDHLGRLDFGACLSLIAGGGDGD